MKKLVKFSFWTFWTVSVFVGLVESFFYPGLITRILGVSMIQLVVTTGLLSFVLLLLRMLKKDRKIRRSDKFFYIFSAVLVLLFVVFKLINRLFPSNSLYIKPNSFIIPAVISLFPVGVILIPQINFKKILKIQTIFYIFLFLLVARNVYMNYKTKWEAYQFILAHPTPTYKEKMQKVIGRLSYDYAQFVVSYTPQNSTLLVPPQAFPWPSSGNIGYFRYFTHPRTLIGGEEFNSPSKDSLSKIDFILLNWGETDRVENEHTHDWPKFDVKAEKIIFMNEDGTYGGEVKGDYHYKNYKGKRVWGLIVVKH